MVINYLLLEFEYFSESVEWHSCFQAWDYSNGLGNLVVKLATARLRDCCDDAKISYLTIMKKVQESGRESFENANKVLEIDDGIEIEGVPFEIEERLIFNNTDKYEFVSEYLSSFALVSGGLIAFKFLGTVNLGLGKSALRSSKLLCAGIALGGLIIIDVGFGLFLIKFADMKNVIQSKAVENLSKFLSTTSFVSRNSEYLAKTSKRKLRSSLLSIAKQVHFEVDETEILMVEKGLKKEFLEKRRVMLETVLEQAKSLSGRLQDIHVALGD